MKKAAMLGIIAAVVVGGLNAAAEEVVDIGSGRMERAEFVALQTKVRGTQGQTAPVISTPLTHLQRYGIVEMEPKDFDALRERIAGSGAESAQSNRTVPVQMIDIGTGEMPKYEFMALKRMIDDGVVGREMQ